VATRRLKIADRTIDHFGKRKCAFVAPAFHQAQRRKHILLAVRQPSGSALDVLGTIDMGPDLPLWIAGPSARHPSVRCASPTHSDRYACCTASNGSPPCGKKNWFRLPNHKVRRSALTFALKRRQFLRDSLATEAAVMKSIFARISGRARAIRAWADKVRRHSPASLTSDRPILILRVAEAVGQGDEADI